MIEIERQIIEAPAVCAVVRALMLRDGDVDIIPDVWVERFQDEQGDEIPELVFSAEDVGTMIAVATELQAIMEEALQALAKAKGND